MTAPQVPKALAVCLRAALTRTPRLKAQWESFVDQPLGDAEILRYLRVDLEPPESRGGPDSAAFYAFRGGETPTFVVMDPEASVAGLWLVAEVRAAFSIPDPRGDHKT